jgi:hypothetical protein
MCTSISLQNTPQNASQSGNAFWFILLAIALLVALTVTITKSGENTEETGQRDRDRIQASDILRQAKSMESAIQQMRIAGQPENDISFENSYVSGYANASCPDGQPCRIFGSGGAGLAYKLPPADWLDSTHQGEDLYGEWYFFATSCVPGIGTGNETCNGDDAATELMVSLPYINKSLCLEINRLVGVQNLTNPVSPPENVGSAYSAGLNKFTGTYTATSIINSSANAFLGKPSGCFAGDVDPDDGYHFYHVLIAR